MSKMLGLQASGLVLPWFPGHPETRLELEVFDGSATNGFEAALLLSMSGHGCGPRVENEPALAGYGAEAVRDAVAHEITTLPGGSPGGR